MTTRRGDKPLPRGGRGRFTRSIDTAERDAEACRLRVQHCTYEVIAQRLGYSHRDLARRAIERALTATVREPADEVRQLELARLDDLARRAQEVADRDHVTVSHGRIIRDDDNNPVLDDGPRLQAIDRLLKIQVRRAALLGLDAPTRHEVMTVDAIDLEIRQLTAELAGGAAAGETAGAAPSSGTQSGAGRVDVD